MEILVKQQLDLSDQMEKFKKNVGKIPIIKRTKHFYAGRVSGWMELWIQFRTNHSKIIELKTDGDKPMKYFVNEVFDDVETQHYEFKAELEELLEKYSKPSNVAKNDNEQVQAVASYIKLPAADLPKFGGDYAKWISFRDRFLSIIKNAGAVSEIQKLDFLISHLEAEALQLVEYIPIQENSFNVVWDSLQKRYENTKLLVNAQLKNLFSQQVYTNETSQNLKAILDTTNQCVENLKHLNIDTTHWDPILVFLVAQKLPSETFILWKQQQESTSRLPPFTALATFLENRFQVLESISQSNNLAIEKNMILNSYQEKRIMQTYHAKNVPSCPMCSKPHSLGKFIQFKKLSVQERENIVKKNSLCFNCFARSHMSMKCTSDMRCFECKKKHHTLLHTSVTSTSNPSTSKGSSNLSPDSKEFEIKSNFAMKYCKVLLATAVINLRGQDDRIWSVRALIDPGSQGSFITENMVQKAGLKRLSTRAIVTGFGQTETGRSKTLVNAIIQSRILSGISVETDVVVLKNLTSLLPSCPIPADNWKNLSNLQLADPNYNSPASIDMLLGADVYPKILLEGVQKFGVGCPVAQNTVFGWVLSGPVNNNSEQSVKVQSFFNQIELDTFLKRFWEMEEICKPIPKSEEDEWCERFFQETHSRDIQGKYCVRLPFSTHKDGPILGKSQRIALKRLENVERRLEKDEALKNDYKRCIQEYKTLGHMRKIHPEERDIGSHYFIPHHAVIKETSLSTKLRVVFDASCKTSNGKSLNDQLYTGPRLQPDITAILTRWRCFKFVVCTDVEKMYRQIWVHPEDTKYQKILWRNEHGVIENFELLTVTFGVSSAPWLAIRTLNQLAEDEELSPCSLGYQQ